MRRTFAAAILATLAFAAPADAHPCDPKPPRGAPHRLLLDAFDVLRRPAATAERPPRDVRDQDGRPFLDFARKVALPTGGVLWIVPLSDVTDRVVASEACIRTFPRRYRGMVREQKRRDARRPAVQGMIILPFAEDGRSRGGSMRGGVLSTLKSGLWHHDGNEDETATVVVGLVPDTVARVRVTIAAFTDERRRKQPRREAIVEPTDNVFATELPSPMDFETPDPVVTWLDATGAPIGPAD